MPEHFLVVSSGVEWLEATKLVLESPSTPVEPSDSPPPRVTFCATNTEAASVLRRNKVDPVTAVILDGYHRGPKRTADGSVRGSGALELTLRLRRIRARLPVLYATSSVRLDLLQMCANEADATEIIEKVSFEHIRQALRRAKKLSSSLQEWAQIDFFLGVEAITVRVTLANGEIISDSPLGSNLLPFLEAEHRLFGPKWELYIYDRPGAQPRTNDGYSHLKEVGEQLHQLLISEPQRTAIKECLQRVKTMENIHFRFITDSFAFSDVPFEAIWDYNKKRFVRDLSPVARRIKLRPSEYVVAEKISKDVMQSLTVTERLTGRMLIIQSSTSNGTLRVAKRRFRGSNSVNFSRLVDLNKEVDGIVDARRKLGPERTTVCSLQNTVDGLDSFEQMSKQLQQGPWDIVHFCGHSIRSDDDEVFLVLPGVSPGKLAALSVAAFADLIKDAQVRLLILSSCEGASSHSLFRLAQEGIPSIVGFRWEVMSDEANLFSLTLHQGLAEGVPLGKAYLHAVKRLGQERPAFLSSMLVVHEDAWADSANMAGA